MIHVYGLVESGKQVGQIRYIGITTDPDQRLSQHRATKEDTDKGRWIADLRKSGKSVDMVLLDSAATRDEAHVKENAWILFARSRGWCVTNSTAPGEHRALLESEIASIEDVVTMVSKLMTENAAIKAHMVNELELERQRHIEQQKIFDAHFNKKYQLAVGVVLAVAAITMVAWVFNGYSYQNAVQRLGVVEATSFLVGMIITFPSIAMALWVILKDVPLYRQHALSTEWVKSLDAQQSISYNAIKRTMWHTAGVAAILGAIALFGD